MSHKPVKLATLGKTHHTIGKKGDQIDIIVSKTPRTVRFFRVHPAQGEDDRNCYLIRSIKPKDYFWVEKITNANVVFSECATPIAEWLKQKGIKQ